MQRPIRMETGTKLGSGVNRRRSNHFTFCKERRERVRGKEQRKKTESLNSKMFRLHRENKRKELIPPRRPLTLPESETEMDISASGISVSQMNS